MEQLKIVAHGVTFDTPVLSSNAVFWKIKEPEYARLKQGEQVAWVRYDHEVPMKVIKNLRQGVILTPLVCDLNELCDEKELDDEAYNSEELLFDCYRLNTFGVIHAKTFSHGVRIVSISKLGIGFTIPKFCLNFDDTYRLTIMCEDEPVNLQVTVRYAHLQEKGIYYSSAIRSIGSREIDLLRYYTASQQLH